MIQKKALVPRHGSSLNPFRYSLKCIALGALALVSLNACSGGHSGSSEIPTYLTKRLGTGGEWSASLEVYQSGQQKTHEEQLAVDAATGKISSKPFDLDFGFSYGFLAIYTYSAPHLQAPLILGYGTKLHKITEPGEQHIQWTEADTQVVTTALSEELKNYIPEGRIPKLDQDGDGYDNYFEVKAGSNPFDPGSIPKPPQKVPNLEGEAELANQQDSIKIVLSFSDPLGIYNIEPESPACGYSQWEIKSLDEFGELKQLTATFNAHSIVQDNNTELKLRIKVANALGLAASYELTTELDRTPDGHGPEIAILEPRNHSEVSGQIELEAIACDKTGITELKLIELANPPGDQDLSAERYFAPLQTESLGDGTKTIKFQAGNSDNQTVIRALDLKVNNQSPIKIDTPAPGSDISGNFNLRAYVDASQLPAGFELAFLKILKVTSPKSPLSTATEEGEDPSFKALSDSGSDTDNSASVVEIKNFDTSFEPKERDFTVVLEAVSSNGQASIIRSVKYKINRDPDIRFYVKDMSGILQCLETGTIKLNWEITNYDPTKPIQFYIDGELIWEQTDLKLANMVNYSLDCNLIKWGDVRELRLVAQGILPSINSEAKLEVKLIDLGGFDSVTNILASALEYYIIPLQGANPETEWQVSVYNVQANKTQTIEGQGAKIKLVNPETLDPLLATNKTYKLQIDLLNSQGNPYSIIEPKDLNTTPNIAGWWRFNNANSPEIDSANNNNISVISNANVVGNCISGSCMQFLGVNNSWVKVNNNNNLNPNFDLTLEVWVKWDEDLKGMIFEKANQYGLGFDPQKPGVFGAYLVDKNNKQHWADFDNVQWQSLKPNKWYYIVAIFKGDNFNGTIRVDINNISMAQNDQVNGAAYIDTKDLYLGSGNFKGYIDEASIYLSTFTDSEIFMACNSLIEEYCP